MIHVIDNYYIDSDGINYEAVMLFGKRLDKNGKETQSKRTIGYYRNINQALQAITKQAIYKEVFARDMELTEAIEIIKNCFNKYEKLIDTSIGDA